MFEVQVGEHEMFLVLLEEWVEDSAAGEMV
jgi:hypothetical protein